MPIHPYIPNSVPEIKEKMLKEIGVDSIDDLFSCIPDSILMDRPLHLPPARSEFDVLKEIEEVMSKNRTTNELLCFLGAGCWPHFIPAVCNEINARSEFLTAYTGDVYTDLGRYQVLFEFQSMIGDLVSLDAVGFPLYDWSTANGDAVRMAMTITGRNEILVPASICQDRFEVIRTHCEGFGNVQKIGYDSESGLLDIEELNDRISDRTAAVFIENPSFLGHIETQAEEIGKIAHENESEFIVGVDPLSLGVLRAPGDYGADIVTGEGQPLGMPMAFGGALMGFLATRDEMKYVEASGNRMITITTTEREGEHGFAYIMSERTIFCSRDKAPTSTGTATVLWAITAAVYLSLLGPKGLRELGKTIMQNSRYTMMGLDGLNGVEAPTFDAPHFKEFTVRFPKENPIADVHKKLIQRGILGGKDLNSMFPELGNSALYCVTEVHSQENIDYLVRTIEEVIS